MCILPIALYRFFLWHFKNVLLSHLLKKPRKMQWRATIWIMEAFCISPTYRIETIASLISIYLYLNKISSWQQLRTASLPSNHAINLLLKYHYSKNTPPHYLSLEALTPKQRLKVKSSIIDTNNCLNGNFPFFNFFIKNCLLVLDL